MAFADWNNLTSITREKVLPKIVDQISKDQPLLGRLFDNISLWKGGKTIEQPVKYRHNSQGGSYSGLEVLSTSQEQTRTRAQWEVKQLYQPIVLSNIDLAKNKGEGVADLMATEMEEAEESLKDKFCTQLFSDGTGNNGKNLTGLIAAIDDSTYVDTYGGIVRSTYTWFKANYSNANTALTVALMATMFDSCTSGQDSPDLIVTTKTLFTKYEAVAQTYIRFMAQNGSVNKADMGIKGLSFRGALVIADEYCPSGNMWFINTKYVRLFYMKHPEHPTDKRGFAMTPLRNPVNQDGQVGFIFWYGQLVNLKPVRSGRMIGLS